MSEHYHTSIDHIFLTVVVVALGFQAMRMGAAMIAKSQSPGLQTVGKAIGSVFTFA